jgi:AraC-like DNA-binding protein
MVATDLPRGTASARVLLEVALRHGLEARACLDGTGLDVALLRDPTWEIRGSQEERLLLNVVEHLGDDSAVALEAGQSYSLPTFGMFGLAIMSAATAREMMELSVRYQELSVTLARCRLVRGFQQTFIEIDASRLDARIQHFVVDHCMAVVWSHTCALDGVPLRVTMDLSRARPRDTSSYRRAFGFEPRFSAGADRIGFNDAYLDRRRAQVDPLALEQCRDQCEVLVRRRRARLDEGGLAPLVRQRVDRAAGDWPSMRTIAADLNLSTRTLARRLAIEGTSFREIDEAARCARAERLLRETLNPVESVAASVGYATNSAFVRAFKRWHAVPPGTWRQTSS